MRKTSYSNGQLVQLSYKCGLRCGHQVEGGQNQACCTYNGQFCHNLRLSRAQPRILSQEGKIYNVMGEGSGICGSIGF